MNRKIRGRGKLVVALVGALLGMVLIAGFQLFTSAGISPSGADPWARRATSERLEMPMRSASQSSGMIPARSLNPARAENPIGSGERPLTSPNELLIPVAGVGPDELADTYSDARSDGRRHDAIDIMAPRGTAVLAAAEGTVLKLFESEQGGITLYQLDTDQRTLYYYAHLDRYASAVVEGMQLRQGETIGYVGNTGNAGAGNYHLHFEISTTPDPSQYWGGTPVNPYPLLRGTTDTREVSQPLDSVSPRL